MKINKRILVVGALPPPNIGPHTLFRILMDSEFPKSLEVKFFIVSFFSFQEFHLITLSKLLKLTIYLFSFILRILSTRPKYILYPISFNKFPFFKDLLFIICGRLFGCKIVQYDYGQYLPEFYYSGGRNRKRLINFMLKNIEAIIVMGGGTKKLYAPFFFESKIYIVPGSVPDTVISFEKPLKTKHATINVLYFSVLSKSKGLFTALNSIPGVVSQNPNIRFVFAGQVDSANTLLRFQEFISNNKLEKFVNYQGYIEDEIERLLLYRNADIFIFPTERDVFGLVILHAMSESLPVISTIEGNIPEIIEEGVNGYLIAKGDSENLKNYILKLADDPTLRETIGNNNRKKFISEFTPVKYGNNMIKALTAIIE